MIPESELRDVFETIWHDRARAVGWTLNIEQDGDGSVFRFKR
jgi:hypothetical protein